MSSAKTIYGFEQWSDVSTETPNWIEFKINCPMSVNLTQLLDEFPDYHIFTGQDWLLSQLSPPRPSPSKWPSLVAILWCAVLIVMGAVCMVD
jgi:hypothetical protein